jgi:hypothetical protein
MEKCNNSFVVAINLLNVLLKHVGEIPADD